jgi:Right handed beta helix region
VRLALLFLAASGAFAADYYVANEGSDNNPGTSAAPWATPNRFINMCFAPGDRILFAGRQTFAGRIYVNLGCRSEGMPSAPILFDSYGSGRALIDGGFEAENKGGIVVQNLVFFSSNPQNAVDGVAFYSTLHDGVGRQYIRVANVEARQFGGFGIVAGSWWADSGGYSDVRITQTISHDNRKGGVVTYGSATGSLYVNKNIYVGYSSAYNNAGYKLAEFPGGWKPEGTGNGILLGSVDGAVIEQCSAYNNGSQNDYIDGPVGIMVYDSRNVIVQNNASFNNKTLAHDGNGFSLDRNTSNSILQNNWSHDNYGVGLYLAQNTNDPFHYGNIVRYNLSENDGGHGTYAGLSLWGPMHDVQIYNNRVIVTSTSFAAPPAVSFSNALMPGAYIRNVALHDNVFQSRGASPLVYFDPGLVSGSIGIVFKNNWYFADNFAIIWADSIYGSAPQWQADTGQEQ